MEKTASLKPTPVPVRHVGSPILPQRLGVGAALRDIYIPGDLPDEFMRLLAKIR